MGKTLEITPEILDALSAETMIPFTNIVWGKYGGDFKVEEPDTTIRLSGGMVSGENVEADLIGGRGNQTLEIDTSFQAEEMYFMRGGKYSSTGVQFRDKDSMVTINLDDIEYIKMGDNTMSVSDLRELASSKQSVLDLREEFCVAAPLPTPGKTEGHSR